MSNVTVFVDYQNAHLSAHEVWCADGAPVEDCVIHPLRLAELLVGRRKDGGQLHEVHVYRGRPDPRRQGTLASANDSQKQEWETDPRVRMHRRMLRYPDDWPTTPAREKGVDVELAIDVVRLAMTGSFDAAIVVSRDTDLVPALEAVRELHGPHIEVATWEGSSRIRLESGPLWCHMLSETDLEAVKDPKYYGPKGPYNGPRPRI